MPVRLASRIHNAGILPCRLLKSRECGIKWLVLLNYLVVLVGILPIFKHSPASL